MSALQSTSRSHTPYSASALATTSRSSVTSSASSQRKLHRNNFSKFYADICHLQHSHPLQIVKQHLERGVLDFIGDRIKFDEWYPIVSALRWDQSLHRVAIRLRHRVQSPLMDADTDLKARNASKQPALTTKFVLFWLLEAIKKCLSQSPALTVLELDGLPLRGEFTALLAQGVLETRSLQHLSLSKCGIQDDGADVLCLAVRNAATIIGLDLSHCDLTEVGAMSLAKLLSLQKLNRYSEAWKQTLRYRDPDVDGMAGLRRITLNHNPELGDRGIQIIAEEVRDDLWLRALDLQDTGLTDVGAAHLIQLVRANPNLTVVDARDNPAISSERLSEIMAVLAINNADKTDSEYKWMGSSTVGHGSGEGKKTNSLAPTLRPWGSNMALRPHSKAPPPSCCSSAPIGSSCTRSQSSLTQKDMPTWRVQDEVLVRENESLRRQVQELNDILNHEMRVKLEQVREAQNLKDALEKCQLEKKQLVDEFSNKTMISEDTLMVLEETLSRLAGLSNNEDLGHDDSDIPELLSSMKAVLHRSHSTAEQKSVQLNLKPLKPENYLKSRNWKSKVSEQVIWEVEEPPSTDRSSKPKAAGAMKAQELFAKILSKNHKNLEKNYEQKKLDQRKFHPIVGSSTDEESS